MTNMLWLREIKRGYWLAISQSNCPRFLKNGGEIEAKCIGNRYNAGQADW